MGAANAAAGFTSGFPIGASGSRTAVNDGMGARSQVAGAVAAVTVGDHSPVPDRAGAVSAQVRARRGDRVGRDRTPRACRMAFVGGRRRRRGGDRRRHARLRDHVRRVGGVGRGRRPVADRHRPSQRPTPHDAVLGWVERLGRYADVSLHPSDGHARRRRLPPRRPAVLRQREVLHGSRQRGDPGRAVSGRMVGVRRRGNDACRHHRSRSARRSRHRSSSSTTSRSWSPASGRGCATSSTHRAPPTRSVATTCIPRCAPRSTRFAAIGRSIARDVTDAPIAGSVLDCSAER